MSKFNPGFLVISTFILRVVGVVGNLSKSKGSEEGELVQEAIYNQKQTLQTVCIFPKINLILKLTYN